MNFGQYVSWKLLEIIPAALLDTLEKPKIAARSKNCKYCSKHYSTQLLLWYPGICKKTFLSALWVSVYYMCASMQDVIFILPESIVVAVYWLVNSFVLVWTFFIPFSLRFVPLWFCQSFDKILFSRGWWKSQAVDYWVKNMQIITQGSIVTCLRCDWIFTDDFITNLWPSLTAKELW